MSRQAIALATTVRGTFRVDIDAEVSAPALALSNSLGTTLEMGNRRGLRLPKASGSSATARAGMKAAPSHWAFTKKP